jgi:hypothetical protein
MSGKSEISLIAKKLYIMLSENEIIEVANNFLKDLEPKIGEPLIFPKELMIKKKYGMNFLQKSGQISLAPMLRF